MDTASVELAPVCGRVPWVCFLDELLGLFARVVDKRDPNGTSHCTSCGHGLPNTRASNTICCVELVAFWRHLLWIYNMSFHYSICNEFTTVEHGSISRSETKTVL
jgi:hypothetical protein